MYLSYLSVINICHYVLVYHHVLHFQKTIYSTIHLYTQLCISVSRTKHMHHILSCFPITSFILRQKEMSLITLLFTLRTNKEIGAPRLIFILFPIRAGESQQNLLNNTLHFNQRIFFCEQFRKNKLSKLQFLTRSISFQLN